MGLGDKGVRHAVRRSGYLDRSDRRNVDKGGREENNGSRRVAGGDDEMARVEGLEGERENEDSRSRRGHEARYSAFRTQRHSPPYIGFEAARDTKRFKAYQRSIAPELGFSMTKSWKASMGMILAQRMVRTTKPWTAMSCIITRIDGDPDSE